MRSVYYETAYKKCKNKTTNLIRTSKENYFKAKLSDSKNSKESWQIINELLNKKSKTSQIREINFDGKTVTKDELAGFNEYFSTIGSMLGPCPHVSGFVCIRKHFVTDPAFRRKRTS